MSYLDLLSDPRRRMDMLAYLQGGMLPITPAGGSPLEALDAPRGEEFGLDDFARESGIAEEDLTPFFQELQMELARDPQLLQQLNDIRKELGLPEFDSAGQAGLQDPQAIMGEDLMALMIMWALQQKDERRGQTLGNLQRSSFNNTRPVNAQSWGSTPSSGGGGTGAPTGAHPDLTNMPTGQGTVGDFLKAALAQDGDNYVFGAEVDLNDANPDTFDCSELVQWACAQAGINIPDGTMNQEPYLQQHGAQISLEEAINTPGALLYKDGHVAISLGDGRTIEAMGSSHGVKIGNARGRFTRGYVVPGMDYGSGSAAA